MGQGQGSYIKPVSDAIPLNDRTIETTVTMAHETFVDLEVGTFVGEVVISINNIDALSASSGVNVLITTQNATAGLGIPLFVDPQVVTGGSHMVRVAVDGSATLYGYFEGATGANPVLGITKVRG